MTVGTSEAISRYVSGFSQIENGRTLQSFYLSLTVERFLLGRLHQQIPDEGRDALSALLFMRR